MRKEGFGFTDREGEGIAVKREVELPGIRAVKRVGKVAQLVRRQIQGGLMP